MKHLTIVVVVLLMLLGSSVALAADDAQLQDQIQALQKRVAELESQQSSQAYQQRNAELIRQMVTELANNQKTQAADTGITAGYDKGFFIKSVDDQFRLDIKSRLQFRYAYMQTNDGNRTISGKDNSSSAFELERARLDFKGHVMKDINYFIELEAGDDATTTQSDGSVDRQNVTLLEYWINYSFIPEFGAQVGRWKMPFGNQYVVSSGKKMLIDDSLATQVFNIGYADGVAAFGALPCADSKLYYQTAIFNGFRDLNRTPFNENSNTPAFAGRIALPMMGATPDDFADESDLKPHANPVAQVGVSAAWAEQLYENNSNGGDGRSMPVLTSIFNGVNNVRGAVYPDGDVTQLGADAAFKSNGLSLLAEGFYQHVNIHADGTSLAEETALADPGVNNFGWFLQGGYFIVPEKFELAARIGEVCVDSANDAWEYAGGWNWYLAGQDLKLSMDISYINDLPGRSRSSDFLGEVNEQLLLIRSQLQFQF